MEILREAICCLSCHQARPVPGSLFGYVNAQHPNRCWCNRLIAIVVELDHKYFIIIIEGKETIKPDTGNCIAQRSRGTGHTLQGFKLQHLI